MRNFVSLPSRIVAAVVLAIVALAPVASAQTSAVSGVIAYVGQSPGGIYVISDDASPKRLTARTPGDQGGPLAWSADGRRIAFSDNGLVVVDVTNGQVRQLTDRSDDTSPSWDNLGNLWFRQGSDLYRTRLNGSPQKVETECGAGPGEVSPDGRRFVYTAGNAIHVCGTNASGGDDEIVTAEEPVFGPRWSPNGQRIVYFTTPSDGDPTVNTVGFSGSGVDDVGVGAWPDWSLDGTTLVMTATDESSDLFLSGADGSNRRRLQGATGTAPSWGRKFRQATTGGTVPDQPQQPNDDDSGASDRDDGTPAERRVGTVEADPRPTAEADAAGDEKKKKKRSTQRDPKASPESFAAPETEDGPSRGLLIAGILGGLAMMGAGSGIGFWLLRRGGA